MLSPSRPIAMRSALACAVLALAACERGAEQQAAQTAEGPSSEVGWARAALERNPDIEVVATDPSTRVITIRDRASGELQAVRVDEIAAVPLKQLAAQARTAPESAPEPPAGAPAEPGRQEREQPEAGNNEALAQQSAPASDTPAATELAYRIERTGGQLRVTGPGVSIVSSGEPPDAAISPAALRTDEPIICEGRRMMHLDGRTMHVSGDAITARDGCELFITNSRIVASGTGVVVRNAIVHVSNSHIEGAERSFDADADSKMFVRASTFQGLPRRHELAMVQDQGGNRWR